LAFAFIHFYRIRRTAERNLHAIAIAKKRIRAMDGAPRELGHCYPSERLILSIKIERV
jgi:hypothetical protein